MRSLAMLALLAGLTLPLFAEGPVNVKDVAALLASSHGKSDGHLAKQLYDLKLTERLSTARLSLLEAELPGQESRKALLALADASAFLDLPAAEVPATAPPDAAAQKQFLTRAVDYVKRSIPFLPDFMATQDVVQFSDVPAKAPGRNPYKTYGEKLHVVSESRATVRFLAGKEEVAARPAPPGGPSPGSGQMSVQGVFGPIFSVVQKDVLAGHPAWSHWEPLASGTMAVFRYAVPQGSSHFVVQDSQGQGILAPVAAYHGEIGLDPQTGAILRLTLIADERPDSPVERADILIEYGPQMLGGKSFICPAKSVAVSFARDVNQLEGLYTYPLSARPPFKLELNDTSYTEYHLFHAEMRVLTGDDAPDSSKAPAQPHR